MNDRKLGRREFLQAVGATALLAGLSHFRFLNITASTALASPLDGCAPPAVPDYCDPGDQDSDICPDINATSSDVCLPSQGETDICDASANEPDDCNSADQPPDKCVPGQGDPDGCEQPPVNTPDTCRKTPDDHDICPDGPRAMATSATRPGRRPTRTSALPWSKSRTAARCRRSRISVASQEPT